MGTVAEIRSEIVAALELLVEIETSLTTLSSISPYTIPSLLELVQPVRAKSYNKKSSEVINKVLFGEDQDPVFLLKSKSGLIDKVQRAKDILSCLSGEEPAAEELQDDDDDASLSPPPPKKRRKVGKTKRQSKSDALLAETAKNEFELDTDVVDTTARQNLKSLLRNSVTEAENAKGVSNPEKYGLSKTAWRSELAILLRKCPLLTKSDLRQTVIKLCKIDLKSLDCETEFLQDYLSGRIHLKIRSGWPMGTKEERKFLSLEKSPIIRELRIKGFEAFNPFEASEIERFEAENPDVHEMSVCCKTPVSNESIVRLKEEEFVLESLKNSTSAEKESLKKRKGSKYRPGDGKTGRVMPQLSLPRNRFKSVKIAPNPCDVWLPKQREITVTFKGKALTEVALVNHSKTVQRPLRADCAFAIVALSMSDEEPALGKVLMRSCHSPESNLDQEMSDVLDVFELSFGFSKEDMYKRTHIFMKLESEGKKYFAPPSKSVQDRLLAMSKDDLEIDAVGPSRTLIEESSRTTRSRIVDPTPETSTSSMVIKMVPNLDPKRVNNVAILLGNDPENVTMRCLFTEDLITKFIKNSGAGPGKPSSESKTNNMPFLWHVCLNMIDFFYGISDGLTEKIPTVTQKLEEYRSLRNLVSFYDQLMNREEKQCPSCGKVFRVASKTVEVNRFKEHTKKCELESAACDCPNIAFKSPADKRRHMKLVHSGKVYIECPFCPFINLSQTFMDNHVEFTHGVQGSEKSCDLCPKTFKSRYHLNIHQFNHENYLCVFCAVEIVGRSPFNNHMKKIHRSGHQCDVCDKMLFTKSELDLQH